MKQILINITDQTLILHEKDKIIRQYQISSAKAGVGEQKNSFQTPRGWHIIRAKIGQDLAKNTVFVGRRPTGEIYNQSDAAQFPMRDWILTRILWLSGLERGKNRLGHCDTMQRYIYIHGTHDESSIGRPASHGCIRMRNDDIIELFDLVPVGTKILIQELI